MKSLLPYLTFIVAFLMFGGTLFILAFWRMILKKLVMKYGKIVLQDDYQENISELLPGLRHMGIQNLLENSLRAETGDVLHRPLGSSKKWPHLDSITFIPAQTTPFPVSSDEDVDIQVTIGPKAKKPLKLKIPLIISGMGYGLSLSEEARLALAQAANNAGTAINSGEGGILPEELDRAGNYILQFSKTAWGKDKHIIKRANMIEIKLGQGALFGMGVKISPKNITGKAREIMGLKENEDAVIYEHFFENQTIDDLKQLVDDLRRETGGVPIGVKIGAGGYIEEDIDNIIKMGVDYIAVDGGQGGSYGAPPILADDMGIPMLHATFRAYNHLVKRNMKEHISLIVSGKLLIPGHFLKALALGADAVYLGSSILFSLSHHQSLHALPFEPPTQIVWNEGKYAHKFNMEEGVKSAENFLTSSSEEMKIALRAMGKRSLKELTKNDLVSHDILTANMLGIPYTFDPWEENISNAELPSDNPEDAK